MKTIIIMLLVAVSTAFAQYEASSSITFTLTDTDCTYIYAARTYGGMTYLSTTSPTASTLPSVRYSPLKRVAVKGVESTGMSSAESDSLRISIDPMYFDPQTRAWVTATLEHRYFQFLFPHKMYRARTRLDWTSGAWYSAAVEDSVSNPLFVGTQAYRLKVKQFNSTSGAGIYTIIPIFEAAK